MNLLAGARPARICLLILQGGNFLLEQPMFTEETLREVFGSNGEILFMIISLFLVSLVAGIVRRLRGEP